MDKQTQTHWSKFYSLVANLQAAKFDFVVVPNHDEIEGKNVIKSVGAIHQFTKKNIYEEENTYLSIKPHDSIKNKIIVSRTPRYRNAFLNYKFLKNTKNLLCIGLKEEFQDLKKEINNLEFYDCKDFLEMAEIIKASKFYVGNMCLQYVISDALKVPRLLEASPDVPIHFPIGKDAFDAYHQIHFEKFFANLNKS